MSSNVTRQTIDKHTRFLVTPPSPCPYLPGQSERKAFIALRGRGAIAVHETLTHAGFRRSQGIAYRPACDGCSACVSARVVTQRFEFTRRWRKVLNRNADISRTLRPAEATEEQFWLLRRYVLSRHGPGGMADMSLLDFAAMIEDGPVRTHVVEYRYTQGAKRGELASFALVDLLADGLSLVYSCYDVDDPRRSLGAFVILDHVAQARMVDFPHVYLGYWVKGSDKMGYKAEFQPLELLRGGVWRPFEDTDFGERAPPPISP